MELPQAAYLLLKQHRPSLNRLNLSLNYTIPKSSELTGIVSHVMDTFPTSAYVN